MIIRYADGTTLEAVILSRTDSRIRVAVKGSEDALEFTERGDTWVSEDCEPVQIVFAWQGKTRQEIVREADCLCSHELAARLIHRLRHGDRDDLKHEVPAAPVECIDSPRRVI